MNIGWLILLKHLVSTFVGYQFDNNLKFSYEVFCLSQLFGQAFVVGVDPVKTSPQFRFVAYKILIIKYFVHTYACILGWKFGTFRDLVIC